MQVNVAQRSWKEGPPGKGLKAIGLTMNWELIPQLCAKGSGKNKEEKRYCACPQGALVKLEKQRAQEKLGGSFQSMQAAES